MKFHGSMLLLAALLALCAAVARGQAPTPAAVAVPAAPAEPPAPVVSSAPMRDLAPSSNYHLQFKDTVRVTVFGQADLDTAARIDSDGNIAFPLLGKARIGGETIEQATETMTELLKYYLVHPQVSIEIVSYVKQHFTVLGQVNKPGIFDIPDETALNLLEAIGMAGGYTKIADPHHIIVRRIVDGDERLIKLDGTKILKSASQSGPIFEILPGDTINIGEAWF